MNLYILLSVLSGCDPKRLDNPKEIETLLKQMVEAANFTLCGIKIHKFEPQGVTGMALVGESHIALHTWPEEGRLFVDVGSCTSENASRQALCALQNAFPDATFETSEIAYNKGSQGWQPAPAPKLQTEREY